MYRADNSNNHSVVYFCFCYSYLLLFKHHIHGKQKAGRWYVNTYQQYCFNYFLLFIYTESGGKEIEQQLEVCQGCDDGLHKQFQFVMQFKSLHISSV